MADGSGLGAVQHVVVLMLENRSFDHMLGYLYPGSVSPSGQPFDGLTGTEANPGSNGQPVTVFRIEPATPDAYYMPGADPGEGYMATNDQLYGSIEGPASSGQAAAGRGFVTDFAYTLGWQSREPSQWPVVAGTAEGDIMGCFTPEALPVLSALAKGYAVCDRWFASAPTETLPNRAFACAATSQGHMDDKTHTFSSPTIFGLLGAANLGWAIYGYDAEPLTKHTFTQISSADAGHFGKFADFQAAAAAGTLPAYTFLEPSWGSSGNSQHPNYDVALGEQLIHDVYEALRSSPGWPGTLLVVSYDEHGGCYDHVPPPWGAVPPDQDSGEFGFGFDRFGVRVPTVLVSPLIAPGTVYRAQAGGPPLDHTSVLKTVEQRWNLAALTARDAAAPGFGDVLTLSIPRTDDVLAGVTVPLSSGPGPAAGTVSHLESVRAELISRQFPAGVPDHPAPAVLHLPFTATPSGVHDCLVCWSISGEGGADMLDRQSATESSYQQEAAEGYFGPLAPAKYMRLTTFKPDGIPVSTSVHGVVDGDRAYFRAWKQSDTAKRLRDTDEVQVIACTGLGLAVGPPLDAVARRLPAEKASWVAGKLARKYPFRQRFLIPLVRRTRRWQMAHYELLTYEAAAGQEE